MSEPDDAVVIHEEPKALSSLSSAETLAGGLSCLDQDIRGLMRRLAEVEIGEVEKRREAETQSRDFLLQLVEVLDAFDRVLRNLTAKKESLDRPMRILLGNFRTVRRLFENALSQQGVQRIEYLEADFDPRWHVAAEVRSDASRPQGIILEELKPGYLWRNLALRKSEVVVNRYQNGLTKMS